MPASLVHHDSSGTSAFATGADGAVVAVATQ
jgi:hypothetical protein